MDARCKPRNLFRGASHIASAVHYFDTGYQVFTADEPELPREPVADFLESIDPQICARFLEYLIQEREEQSMVFHDRLAELYLSMTLAAKKRNEGDSSSI
jgi:Vam6/Vps39-like protein vacuolar protein sorting-associated protein 39